MCVHLIPALPITHVPEPEPTVSAPPRAGAVRKVLDGYREGAARTLRAGLALDGGRASEIAGAANPQLLFSSRQAAAAIPA